MLKKKKTYIEKFIDFVDRLVQSVNGNHEWFLKIFVGVLVTLEYMNRLNPVRVTKDNLKYETSFAREISITSKKYVEH